MPDKYPNVTFYIPKGRNRYRIVARFNGQTYTETAGVNEKNAAKRAKQLSDQKLIAEERHLHGASRCLPASC